MQSTPPGTRPTDVPSPWNVHPLVKGRVFYTFPAALLQALSAEFGTKWSNPERLALEAALSEIAVRYPNGVGFANGRPVSYHLFGQRPSFAVSPERERAVAIATQRLDKFREAVRGYAGWLLTNPRFLDEQDGLLRRHCEQLREFGFARPLLSANRPPELQELPRAEAEWVQDFADFHDRWRLQGLASPDLPCPLEPQFPLPLSESGLGATAGGQLHFIPDIFPLVGRGELQETLEDAVRGSERPPHLAEWLEIVEADNPAKNVIGRYARLLELQHFVRVLHQRHADALHRRTTRLRSALAAYFHVSDDTIRNDLRLVDRRLGPGWRHRPDPLTA